MSLGNTPWTSPRLLTPNGAHPARPAHEPADTGDSAWIGELAAGRTLAALTFAGQGTSCLPELADLAILHPDLWPWLRAAENAVAAAFQEQPFAWSGRCDAGFHLERWLREDHTRPEEGYLTSSLISQPLIFITQIARYLTLWNQGLAAAFNARAITVLAGHSQGMMPALLVAESPGGAIRLERFVDYVRYFAWQGLHMTLSYDGVEPHRQGDATPMAAVSGLDANTLESALKRLNAGRPDGAKASIALYNTRTRHVVSGPSQRLDDLRAALTAQLERQQQARRQGRHAGRVDSFTWEFLPVGAAFHSNYMARGLDAMLDQVERMGFRVEARDLKLDVLSPEDGTRLNDRRDLTRDLVVAQFVRPVRWTTVSAALANRGDVALVLDLGPGIGAARLAQSNLRGTGLQVLALVEPGDARALLTPGARPRQAPLRYADLAPRLAQLPDGQLVIDNRYTRWTGQSPVILPGMTPTTADAPIVAAAANAGFTAELAGGGQVTEAIFHERLRELAERLEPGAEIVFNALLLDPYLWGLHLGRQRLVQKARAKGAPIMGVTISAGIPEVAEAVRLLDELAALGITRNAFKPGTLAQIQQVIRVARAAPHHTLIVHLEGGRAGGHHSWEELDDLLLDGYALLRAEPNLILCVGGGVGTPERAADLLTGRWAERYDLPLMPLDGVLLGTVTMACAEALTSPAVKRALAEAPGTERWVLHGAAEGGVTSGRSQLNADIHYLDNAAARCGRLLDEVAGDAAAVEARREEIIAALNATARPWFGDLTSMTYADALQRLVDLMATGKHGRYEDGAWPDVTWRRRVWELLRRAEARLAAQDEGPLDSRFPNPDALDDPTTLVQRLAEAYPAAHTRTLHPLDQEHLLAVCRQPGKPVPFVPVIDADVRRWFKADSLQAAHDDRFNADQVLVIPGPAAVAGITRPDEPVADLLARFEQATVARLLLDGVEPAPARSRRYPSGAPLPVGVEREDRDHTLTLRVLHSADSPDWFSYVARTFRGAPAALWGAERIATLRGASWPAPARLLGSPLPGATLTLELTPSGEPHTIRWHHPDSDDTLQLIATPEGAAMEIAVPGPSTSPARFIRHFEYKKDQIFIEKNKNNPEALRSFYHAALFGAPLEPTPLFTPAREDATLKPDRARAYSALTGGSSDGAHAPLNMAFSLVWRPLMRTLSCDELAEGLLDLVHLSQSVTPGPAWPARSGETLAATARVTRVEDAEAGRTVVAEASLRRGDDRCATLESRFFIRGSFGATPWAVRADEHVTAPVALRDGAAAAWLAAQPWLTLLPGVTLAAGDALTLDVALKEARPRSGDARFQASGDLLRRGKAGHSTVLGAIALDTTCADDLHPVRATLALLAPAQAPGRATSPRTLRRLTCRTPARMEPFAAVSADLNPIHRSHLMARLAGLGAPIVHGMWTAARLHALALEIAGGELLDWSVDFLAIAPCDAHLELEATRTAVQQGRLELTLRALRLDDDGARVPVAQATARLHAPRTAYILPGQGIQQQGMGMEGYARSAAARDVWDRADRATRQRLGFSILKIVRDNPAELIVHGLSQLHPRGVLHLTQFTQVAMAVLAMAQVAELREAGVFVEDAITGGHSVGEYNALAAVVGVLPLEDVIEIVYQRGCIMHTFVPRDAHGESGYRMGVVRPHYARLDHAGAEALVAEIAARTGLEIQIVNYNVKGRQYSVTGRVEALRQLEQALEARRPEGAKAPWIEVPGIDVPFHSRVLAGGVDSFRRTLEARLPARIAYERLVGRYIPNLVARPFALDRSFAQSILDCTGSAVIQALLDCFEDMDHPALARTLLIELLAWQFASPVRWIETQDLLLQPTHLGGMGVERVIEIGVGYQPTLANMANATLQLLGHHAAPCLVLNVEADAARVRFDDADPAPAPEAAEPAPAPAAPVAAPVAAPAAAPATAAAPAGPVADRPLTHLDALRAILAFQARVRTDQLRDDETIDDLFEGVSSRRNQALLDLGAEFDAGAIDGAHEKPLGALADELRRRAPSYRAPGRYLRAAQDEALSRVLGRARLRRRDAEAHLRDTFGLPDAWIERALLQLALDTRPGDATRGGPLGPHAAHSPTTPDQGRALLDLITEAAAQALGAPLARRGAAGTSGGSVDAAAVQALEARIAGPTGLLAQQARATLDALGVHSDDHRDTLNPHDPAAERLAFWEAEHGEAYARLIQPLFDPRRHVAFQSAWAWAQRDVARLLYEGRAGRLTPDQIDAEARRLAIAARDPRVRDTATWAAQAAHDAQLPALADALRSIAQGHTPAPATVASSRPHLEITPSGALRFTEQPSPPQDFLAGLTTELVTVQGWDDALRATLHGALHTPLSFKGRTALVTGASPGSIAAEVVRHLLRGGARVVVTTTTNTPERIEYYKNIYQECINLDAELHIIPFNQGSFGDIEALVNWLFNPSTEQSGATLRVLKRPFAPDLVLPFGALSDLTTLDLPSERSLAVIRAMLVGVERLVGAIARRYRANGLPANPCHVVLPLSPNHGTFGGDGAYAETKAALEVMLEKWRSEHHAWGHAVTFAAARIGWVRGTGLMDANNTVAAHLEAATGARTFSSGEMGLLIAALCTPEAAAHARTEPLRADLGGAFDRIPGVREVVERLRAEIAAQAQHNAALTALQSAAAQHAHHAQPTHTPLLALPDPLAADDPAPGAAEAHAWPATPSLALQDAIVLVGAGEVGPWGNARARFEVEVDNHLSAGAVLELAWTLGLVRYENGRWLDVKTSEPVDEAELAPRYRGAVTAAGGIRFIEPAVAGYDPDNLPVMAQIFLERDFTFAVASADEARAFLDADPDHTRVHLDPNDQTWRVTRAAGTALRVPRATRIKRRVAGLVPTGFDFARFGITPDMIENVDRTTLFNLVATVDAFLSAGIEPEELLRFIHPARIANTQGSGIGGMKSIHRLYVDPILGRERQSDVLQETLINVIAAYVVQSYIGSYGPMTHPVAACATAAVSLEEAMDKLLTGRADLAIAGAFDDIGQEGALGFEDMAATCDTDQLLAMGLQPHQMSRANDARRRGFVEAQGGGTFIVARGDVALKLGLPVLGVLAFAGSFSDGIHKSIPAPGLGALAAACGGPDSPLGRALQRWGLSADDIGLVYKHDTSTQANDPNETALHHRIQEALGRTPGNPLWAVSQKSLTGHPKGGAAAWQVLGLCQSLQRGLIPGNRNLDSVDEAMRPWQHLAFTHQTLHPGPKHLRAGLVTSLGFGHVGALALILHPAAFLAMLTPEQREDYTSRAAKRRRDARDLWAHVWMGRRAAFTRRADRRFEHPDHSAAQEAEEAALLLNPNARLDPSTGRYTLHPESAP